MDFSQRLKTLREKHEWTQLQLGGMLNVSDATINRYEKGIRKPDPETLNALADIFEVSVDYLLGRTEIKKQPEIIAAHRASDPMSDLPPEALDELEKLKQYVISKYRKDKPSDK